jgi:hypothetical protein
VPGSTTEFYERDEPSRLDREALFKAHGHAEALELELGSPGEACHGFEGQQGI